MSLCMSRCRTVGGMGHHHTAAVAALLLLTLQLGRGDSLSHKLPSKTPSDILLEMQKNPNFRSLANDVDVNYLNDDSNVGGSKKDDNIEEDAEVFVFNEDDDKDNKKNSYVVAGGGEGEVSPTKVNKKINRNYNKKIMYNKNLRNEKKKHVTKTINRVNTMDGNRLVKGDDSDGASDGGVFSGGFRSSSGASQKSPNLLRRHWGVPDTEAVAGHYFQLVIPEDAFQGTVDRYEMSQLPPWLEYIPSSSRSSAGGSNRLVGVAPRDVSNRQYYTTVTARNSHASAQDKFAIMVVRRPGLSEQREALPGCQQHQQQTAPPALLRLSVVLPVSWSSLAPSDRAYAILGLASVTGLQAHKISLVPAPAQDPSTDGSAVLAGRLMDQQQQQGSSGAPWLELRALVGCGDHISFRKAVARLQAHTAAANNNSDIDNTLTAAMGLPVLGWKIAAVPSPPPSAGGAAAAARQQHQPQHQGTGSRGKRSPDYAAGDYPAYDYDYEYEYDDFDPSDPDYSGSEVDEPEERVVPALATPVFPGQQQPSTAAHDREREPVLPPVLRPVPVSTPLYVPVKPTRVVVEASPTVLYPTARPTYTPPPPHHQPTTAIKQDPGQPTIMVEPTRPLAPSTASVAPTEGGGRATPPPPPRSTTEVVDHLVRNFRPEVVRRIEKLAWVAGFVYRLPIPADTFGDLEDGNSTQLQLLLRQSDSNSLGTQSWIQFDPVKQEIYALPLENDIGFYTFLLEAIDSGGKSVSETVKIQVQQPQQSRNYYHRYSAILRIAKKYEYDFTFSLDWQIRVVQKIAQLFDNSTESINIRTISEKPTKVAWTNVTMVDTQSTTCPEEQLAYMNRVLYGYPSAAGLATHDAARDVVESFKPEFHLKRLNVHYTEPCDDFLQSHALHNTRPRWLNQIDIINTTAGVMYRRQVPHDACYDAEDGEGRKLNMRLLTSSLDRLPLHSWIQFDTNNQEFYGLPLSTDVGSAEYTLECVDSKGGKINDALTVVVNPAPYTMKGAPRPPVVFTLTFDESYTALMNQPTHKALLIRRLGTAFGDQDGGLVLVESIMPGSTVVTWHNSSLPATGQCPGDAIQQLHDIMMTPDGNIRAEFKDHFATDFTLIDGSMWPDGSCLSSDTPSHIPPPDVGPSRGYDGDDAFGFDDVSPARPGVSGEQTPPPADDYLLTFLVPSVLMAAMLVLAAVAACCLYRHRRRYAKMSLTNHASPPDTTTFVTTGIPVILAEELDDHQTALASSRSPLAKTPVIMKEEKPPLPPYRQSPPPTLSSGASVPRRGPNDLPQLSAQPQQLSYQQPPPPFTTNGRSNNSPRNTLQSQPPAYRKPTYMPP